MSKLYTESELQRLPIDEQLKPKIQVLESGIPKIIHQIWMTDRWVEKDMPESLKDNPEKWKRVYPDFIHILWDNKKAYNYLYNFHPESLKLLQSQKNINNKCNILKYHILKDFGGIYCDLDNYPLKPTLLEYINYGLDIYITHAEDSKYFDDSIIVCKKNLLLWDSIFGKISDQKWYEKILPLSSKGITGNILLTNVLENSNVVFGVLPSMLFNPTDSQGLEGNTNDLVVSNDKSSRKQWRSWDRKTIDYVYSKKNEKYRSGSGWFLFIIFVIFFLYLWINKNYYEKYYIMFMKNFEEKQKLNRR